MIDFSNRLSENNDYSYSFRMHPSQEFIYKNFLMQHIPIARFDKNKSMRSSIMKAQVVIATQNSTVFLECLYYNIPVLIFWDININKIKESKIFIFDSAGHIPFVNYKKKCFELIKEFLEAG